MSSRDQASRDKDSYFAICNHIFLTAFFFFFEIRKEKCGDSVTKMKTGCFVCTRECGGFAEKL